MATRTCFFACVIMILPVSMAFADPIYLGTVQVFSGGTLTPVPGMPGYYGGPFRVDPTGPAPYWVTFCLEVTETLSFGTTYHAFINDRAILGGTGSDDPLSDASAAIYMDYIAGRTILGAPLAASEVQRLLWFFEGERTGEQLDFTSRENNLITYYGGSYNAPTLTAHNLVLNLYSLATYDANSGRWVGSGLRQDLMIPVPEPATLFLLGLGFAACAGIGLIRKKE